MNNFGLGIMCFGKEEYFVDTKIKLKEISKYNIPCYILTDNPKYFSEFNINTILYDRKIKSYHDKILLIKHITKLHDFCVLIDADIKIINYDFIDLLKTYNFDDGITYIDTLQNHPTNKMYLGQFQWNFENIDWFNYRKYVQSVYPDYVNLETIYEYFIVINKKTLTDNFYKFYEKLQIIKESCDILSYDRDVIGAGEGFSIQLSANLSNCKIKRDEYLYDILKSKIKNVNKNR